MQRLANQPTLVTYKLKDAIVGINRYIDFCNSSYRIAFLKDFDRIQMVPVPHRNTINFLGMQPKSSYIIWRESNGTFTALDNQGFIRTWIVSTGKTTKSHITAGQLDIKGYAVYECNASDDTYKRNW